MLFSQASVVPKAPPLLCNTTLISLILRPQNSIPHHAFIFHSHSNLVSSSVSSNSCKLKHLPCSATPRKSDSKPDSIPNTNPHSKPRTSHHRLKNEVSQNKDNDPGRTFPTIPRKARRGRRSEAAAVEDFVRDRLEQTFESIKQNNPEAYEAMKNKWNDGVRKKTEVDDDEDDDDNDDISNEVKQQKTVIEEDSQTWPLDAEVGWGTRASDFFEKYPIKTVVGDDGIEIDWEGESDDSFIKEINCLEWESFAFHPSPLIVLVFERYNRATDNWKVLKELEKAAKVYWTSQDKLPPRTVKLDINIERDLAYALDVRECPQVLFLRGNRILYREREMRKADELVQLIAHFYYKAKKPSWINEENLHRPY